MKNTNTDRKVVDDRKQLRDHKVQAEDERGWSGQHGQRPGSPEEKNYRPNQHLDRDGLGSE